MLHINVKGFKYTEVLKQFFLWDIFEKTELDRSFISASCEVQIIVSQC
jgi:hypothetical protein